MWRKKPDARRRSLCIPVSVLQSSLCYWIVNQDWHNMEVSLNPANQNAGILEFSLWSEIRLNLSLRGDRAWFIPLRANERHNKEYSACLQHLLTG